MNLLEKLRNLLKAIGPAIIVASIVLGPGSVLTSSKVGCQFGYNMLWVLAAAVLLMMGMTSLGAYLGATMQRTPCQQLADSLGRPASVALGVLVFLIIACFQSGNNAAVIASIEGLAQQSHDHASVSTRIMALVVLNGVSIATLVGFRHLYRPLELLMMGLVLTMLIAFGVNLLVVAPSPAEILQGFIPNWPAATVGIPPAAQTLWPLLGLVATTFSVAAAFYQCYLVREKGWTIAEVRKGLRDSIVGIALLGTISAIIMIASASALHTKVAADELHSTAEIARQLEPFFGSSASLLFSCGIFAAAFSSFLGNALVGGTVLSDSLGWGSSVNDIWPKRLTILALILGMVIASYSAITGGNSVNFIVFAQALTVLGIPLLAGLMLWLSLVGHKQERPVPIALRIIGGIGFCVTLLLATRLVASYF